MGGAAAHMRPCACIPAIQVFTTTDSVLQTCRPVGGTGAGGPRMYDFSQQVDDNGRLQVVITEIDTQHKLRLQLLDPGEGCGCRGWGETLPVRLRSMHSHWLCRERGYIVVRPPHFQHREVDFLVSFTAPTATNTNRASAMASTTPTYYCSRIPPHLRHLHWSALATERTEDLAANVILIADRTSGVLKALAKFENPDFIHTCTPDSGDSAPNPQRTSKRNRRSTPRPPLIFDLARYGLQFQLQPQNGELHSLQYTGYRLRPQQQLVKEQLQQASTDNAAGRVEGEYTLTEPEVEYTLPRFSRYLVLEKAGREAGTLHGGGGQRADTLVLVPVGLVVRDDAEGCVDVQLPDCCEASLQVTDSNLS